jgi:hypothetical protein
MGNEGDLFRETLPLAVLELAEPIRMTKRKSDEEDDEKTMTREEDERASKGA